MKVQDLGDFCWPQKWEMCVCRRCGWGYSPRRHGLNDNVPVCAPLWKWPAIDFWSHQRGRKLTGEWLTPANNNIYKDTITYNNNNNNNNNNNHLVSGSTRFTQSVDSLRWGLLPPLGGNSWLANLLTPVPPNPRLPALLRQATTYAWRTAFGWYHMGQTVGKGEEIIVIVIYWWS